MSGSTSITSCRPTPEPTAEPAAVDIRVYVDYLSAGSHDFQVANVKQLNGLLPICCYCKRIRTDEDYWQQLETYISEHSDAEFSHGVCPSCFERVASDFRT